jgi:lysophospholipase L1-like esterase
VDSAWRPGRTKIRRGLSTRWQGTSQPLAVCFALVAVTLLSSCAHAASSTVEYYVSLGDSYSVGYQPSPTAGATSGYTAVVVAATHMHLANFGCAGATSRSILSVDGCGAPYGPPASTSAVSHPTQSQAAAAEGFIRSHKGHIGLVTVTIGGNDVTDCVRSSSVLSCFTSAISGIATDVAALASGLRSAAGPHVPILGLTYPDVLLGLWVYPPGGPDRSLATLSVTAFEQYINPTLESAYHKASATFVDITAASGAYTPLTQTTVLAPFGTIPTAVAQTCMLTWYCSMGNVHANDTGYEFIGRQVVKAYDKTTHTS